MHLSSRREFIKTSSALFGALAMSNDNFSLASKKPCLSFSTLGSPKWTWPDIIHFAAKEGFNAIEIRGILGEMDLAKCLAFSTKENILASRRVAEESKIKIIGLGSSANLHYRDSYEWQKSLDSAKRFIDLAHELNSPYVRVFPNKLPIDQEKKATLELISERLLLLGNYAKGSNVSVLMESHGDLVETADLKKIMELASHSNTGLLWDVFNMWSITKDPPEKVYPELRKYIKHTHLKDGKFIDSKWKYVLLGKGECPIFDAIDLLHKDGFNGYYGLEWEKFWHPDIEEPEIAFSDYARVMKNRFK